MNILFFSDNFPPERNAAASRVYEQAYYWIKMGHKVTVITSAPNFPEGKLFVGYKNKFYHLEIIDEIRVIRVKTFIARNKGFFLRTIDYTSYLIPAFLAGMLQRKFHVIIATCPTPFVALAGWGLSVVRRKPFILEVSDLWPASIIAVGAMRDGFVIKLLEKLEIFLYQHAQKIVTLTAAFKVNLIARKIPAKKIEVVLNGVDLRKYSPRPRNALLAAQYQFHSTHFIAGYIGTFGMAHGLENILYTAELLKNHPGIRFLLVGTGAEREKLIELAAAMSLNNLLILDSQPKENIPEFWGLCNVALVHLKNSPIFAEVIPSKIFEAMGMGLPILISAPRGEATQFIESENIGWSLPAENPEALANAVVQLSQNPEKLRELSNNSLRAAPIYSRERQSLAILDIIENVACKDGN